jgi:ubiquinone/menaquinone biosynthesis C-methylase UbiE
VEPRLQRRVQRYGWDLAAPAYESLWQTQLAGVQAKLLECAALAPGERVLDIACGTGLVTVKAAKAVGATGQVLGVDLSEKMVSLARHQARESGVVNVTFERMDAENLALPDSSVDVVVCCLGLMYLPEPERAVCEMRRILRPGGRVVISVWGERSHCGWASLFGIVGDEVASDVCPLFFRLGQSGALARACTDATLKVMVQRRISAELEYASGDDAWNAALAGGPVALAWSRFDNQVRLRVRTRYLESIDPWRTGSAYAVPAEFVVVVAG